MRVKNKLTEGVLCQGYQHGLDDKLMFSKSVPHDEQLYDSFEQ